MFFNNLGSFCDSSEWNIDPFSMIRKTNDALKHFAVGMHEFKMHLGIRSRVNRIAMKDNKVQIFCLMKYSNNLFEFAVAYQACGEYNRFLKPCHPVNQLRKCTNLRARQFI